MRSFNITKLTYCDSSTARQKRLHPSTTVDGILWKTQWQRHSPITLRTRKRPIWTHPTPFKHLATIPSFTSLFTTYFTQINILNSRSTSRHNVTPRHVPIYQMNDPIGISRQVPLSLPSSISCDIQNHMIPTNTYARIRVTLGMKNSIVLMTKIYSIFPTYHTRARMTSPVQIVYTEWSVWKLEKSFRKCFDNVRNGAHDCAKKVHASMVAVQGIGNIYWHERNKDRIQTASHGEDKHSFQWKHTVRKRKERRMRLVVTTSAEKEKELCTQKIGRRVTMCHMTNRTGRLNLQTAWRRGQNLFPRLDTKGRRLCTSCGSLKWDPMPGV